MHQLINFHENGINVVIQVTDELDVRLIHLSAIPLSAMDEPRDTRWHRLVELQSPGGNPDDHHGSKYTATAPGRLLQYIAHRDCQTQFGRKLEIDQQHEGLILTSHLQFYDGVPVVRCWTSLVNSTDKGKTVEYVSSFALTGLAAIGSLPRDEKSILHIPHNTWHGEAQWRTYSLPELGMGQVQSFSKSFTVKRLSFVNSGTWSSAGYLPMGGFQNTQANTTLAFQIDHNGSWHWELSTIGDDLYCQISGPTFNENHWLLKLQPQERFDSVPIGVACVVGTMSEAMQALTRYRRKIRRPNHDNETLPVIFNDYMNCLFGDPTEEKLLPLIDAAADVGCEIFCIDAGWFADNSTWWDDVGDWEPSPKRFPNGFKVVLDRIRQRGMVAGLWLEIEVVGITSRLSREATEAWFFQRNGARVIDHGRHQLDFRNPAVRSFADGVLDRVVREYGVGYIKMDYNINAGVGTDLNVESLGQGLLEHNRAYLAWLDAIWLRYPDLVIENCASGGMRMDYACLARHSIQSTSDQTDYRKTAVIASNIFSAVTPEQAAIWSYPLTDADDEAAIFNMTNAMLGRIHQSGHLAQLTPGASHWVKEGIKVYKSLRHDIPKSIPFWPLGFSQFGNSWLSTGLLIERGAYLLVWRCEGDDTRCTLPLPMFKKKALQIECIYPAIRSPAIQWDRTAGELTAFDMPAWSARLLKINEMTLASTAI